MWLFFLHKTNLTGDAKKAVSDLAAFVATMGRNAGRRNSFRILVKYRPVISCRWSDPTLPIPWTMTRVRTDVQRSAPPFRHECWVPPLEYRVEHIMLLGRV
jgi:hypothetical protein